IRARPMPAFRWTTWCFGTVVWRNCGPRSPGRPRYPTDNDCKESTVAWVLILFLVLVLILTLYGVMLYNNLVALKHNVAKSWSNIDVLLKQRHDELPKLVEVCKQYMGYEQETLEKVMQARSAVAAAREGQNIPALGQAETQLRLGLGGLFAVAEAYPALKANTQFQHLQERIKIGRASCRERVA